MTYLIRCVLTFSKETFFEARKARINLGRPEMEKRKEKKRRREEKILVINVTRRSRSLDRESCWSCSRCCSDIYRFAGVTKPWRPNHVQGSGKSEVELIEITTGLLPLTIHLRSARQSPYSTLLTLDPRFLVRNSILDLATWSEKEKEEKEMSAWSFLSLSRRKRERENISTSVYFQKYYYPFSRICISVNFFFSKKDSDDRR